GGPGATRLAIIVGRAEPVAARVRGRPGNREASDDRLPCPDHRGRADWPRARPLADPARGARPDHRQDRRDANPLPRAGRPGPTPRAGAVQARTLELYRQVGLAGAVVEAGAQVAAANLWVGGAKAARLPLGRMGEGLSRFPYALTYPQDAHERLLIERLDALGVKVERQT